MSLRGAVGKELSSLKADLKRQKATLQKLMEDPVVKNHEDWMLYIVNEESQEKKLIMRYIEKSIAIRRLESRINQLVRERREFGKMKKEKNLRGFVVDDEDVKMDVVDHGGIDEDNIIRGPRLRSSVPLH